MPKAQKKLFLNANKATGKGTFYFPEGYVIAKFTLLHGLDLLYISILYKTWSALPGEISDGIGLISPVNIF